MNNGRRVGMTFVYVVTDSEHIKIGIAGDVRKRLNELRTANPRVTLVAAWPIAGDAMKVEKQLHQFFDDDHFQREWFNRSHQIVEWLDWLGRCRNVARTVEELPAAWSDEGCLPWNMDKFQEGVLPLPGGWPATPPPVRAPTGAGVDTSSSKTQDWYTPREIIDLAREVLGEIDLDPMSCVEANQTVRAKTIYTEENDGLVWPWAGRVWLNPPYGGVQVEACEKALKEYREGGIQAILLCLNSNSSTNKWFKPLFDFPMCFINGRPNFVAPGGNADGSPSKGAVIVYLGPDADVFHKVFSRVGSVVVPFDWPGSGRARV